MIEKAASFWGKAGQRSLERSALIEAAEQFTRALEQIEALARNIFITSRADKAASDVGRHRYFM